MASNVWTMAEVIEPARSDVIIRFDQFWNPPLRGHVVDARRRSQLRGDGLGLPDDQGRIQRLAPKPGLLNPGYRVGWRGRPRLPAHARRIRRILALRRDFRHGCSGVRGLLTATERRWASRRLLPDTIYVENLSCGRFGCTPASDERVSDAS